MRIQKRLSLTAIATALLYCTPSWADFDYHSVNMNGASCLPLTPSTTGTRHNGHFTVTSDRGWVSCAVTTLEGGLFTGHRIISIYLYYTAPPTPADLYNPRPTIPGFPPPAAPTQPNYGCTAGGRAPQSVQPSTRNIQAKWYVDRGQRISGNIVCFLPRGGTVRSVYTTVDASY